MITKIKATF